MSGNDDFVFLYEQLGVAPGCTHAELRRAYRRRVSELHPDRRGPAADPSDAMRLQELTRAYAEATVFQRRHGRLPGAPRHPTLRPVRLVPQAFAPMAPALPRANLLRRLVLALLVIAALAWLVWANAAAP
jgi:DnaJ-like protein